MVIKQGASDDVNRRRGAFAPALMSEVKNVDDVESKSIMRCDCIAGCAALNDNKQ